MSPPGNWSRSAWVRWEEDKLQEQYRAMLAGEWECSPRQFYTANASLPRQRFLEVGGFDAGFQRAEDVELAYRLRDAGLHFVFHPPANILHFASRSFSAWCRTPYQYGRYDVVMERDKGHEALRCALHEFQTRHPLNRILARVCVGRDTLSRAAILTLRSVATAADTLRMRGMSALALSGIFNLMYWQGAADELGGVDAVWRRIAASRETA
jgi:hypothetical protein